MRVLHIYSGNLYGGVESTLATLARCSATQTDVTHEFALCFKGRLSEELDEAGATVTQLGRVRVRYPWTLRTARQRLAALLRAREYTAAICHSTWPLALFGRTVREYSSATLAFWVHDVPKGVHWIERWARRTVPDLAICNSQFTKSLVPRLFDSVKPAVIYNPVLPAPTLSAQRRAAIRTEIGVFADEVLIVQAARLESWKGHRTLIRALSMLGAQHSWKCIVVGGPQKRGEQQYFDSLRAEAARLKLDKQISFLGHRTDARVLLQAGDLFCQPNQEPEPFGIVFVEALYASLPVVTTGIGGGAAEILNDQCAILTDRTPQAVARALTLLIDDGALRRQLSAAGPHRAAELCNPKRSLEGLNQLLSRDGRCRAGIENTTSPSVSKQPLPFRGAAQ